MKTIYNPINRKTYLITNAPIFIGCLVAQESGEITEVKSLSQIEALEAMSAKVLKEVKPVSPYVYPGLTPKLST